MSETLSKLYLELSQVVPEGTMSAKELRLHSAVEFLRRIAVPEGACIHDEGSQVRYCDDCPLAGLHGTPKENKAADTACVRDREFSQ